MSSDVSRSDPCRVLAADPNGLFVHDLILRASSQFGNKAAIIDTSCSPPRRITYSEYGTIVESVARGLTAAGIHPGERIALYLPNSWEFCAAYHATTLAGAVPTPLNPSYREREVRYQLENSAAVMLITDGPLVRGKNLSGLPELRRLYTTRASSENAECFSTLQLPTSVVPLRSDTPPSIALGALPYSSGTTGLPKGVMLSHFNLVTSIYQLFGIEDTITSKDTLLCCLPLYHIYGLNAVLNPALAAGATVVLMPRFDLLSVRQYLNSEAISIMHMVPPMLHALCQAAEDGWDPSDHSLQWVVSGAAPLAPDLARRFSALTGVPVRQGYGMTEAAPGTHFGFLRGRLYRPESIGWPFALTECRIVDEDGNEAASGQPGELVMRGPQFMSGYWRAPEASAAALRDGWFWSGDVGRRDADGLFYVLDRRKEMIKYKGFAVAPAEIEAVLREHAAVRDCGVVSRPDAASGEIPAAFVVLRDGFVPSPQIESELAAWVANQLTSYKQPREFHFVAQIPCTPSGKVLRRELRRMLTVSSK
jgi:long-chain acyl-CoA synthetase